MQFNQSEGIGGYMEYFVLWIKNIAVFYILATLIKNIVPDEKYGKYIKLFLGIIFIVLLLKPVARIGNLENLYEKLFSDCTYTAMSKELAGELDMVSKEQQKIIISGYTGNIENEIKNYIADLGASCDECEVEIDANPDSKRYGMISTIKITAARGNAYNYRGMNTGSMVIDSETNGEGSFLQVQIKNYLSDVYNMDRRNIYVNIIN